MIENGKWKVWRSYAFGRKWKMEKIIQICEHLPDLRYLCSILYKIILS